MSCPLFALFPPPGIALWCLTPPPLSLTATTSYGSGYCYSVLSRPEPVPLTPEIFRRGRTADGCSSAPARRVRRSTKLLRLPSAESIRERACIHAGNLPGVLAVEITSAPQSAPDGGQRACSSFR